MGVERLLAFIVREGVRNWAQKPQDERDVVLAVMARTTERPNAMNLDAPANDTEKTLDKAGEDR